LFDDSSGSSSSSISGFAFFDSNSDGAYDSSTSAGIRDTTVGLFNCTGDIIINTTKTDASGYYSFDGLDRGQYYIISMPQPWYTFSHEWNGKTDETGILLHPNVDNAINPETGSTACFDLEEDEDKTVNFGLMLDVWSNAGPATVAPSNPPSNAPINALVAIATSNPMAASQPSSNPAIIPSSQYPSVSPTLCGTLPRPPSPSITSSNANETSQNLTSSIHTSQMPSASPSSVSSIAPMAAVATSSPTASPSKYVKLSTSLESINATSELTSTSPSPYTLSPSQNLTSSNFHTSAILEVEGNQPIELDIKINSAGNEQEKEGGSPNDVGFVIGIIAAIFVATALVALVIRITIVIPKRNKRKREELSEQQLPAVVGNELEYDLENGLPFSENKFAASTQHVATATTTIHRIIAPARKLDTITEITSNDGTSAYVSEIKDTSRIRREIRVGDMIIAGDDEDVSDSDFDQSSSAPIVQTFHRNDSSMTVSLHHVMAPAGKLGIVVTTCKSGGPATVHEIRETCPIIGQIRVGDEIVAVDDEDVRDMLGVELSALLASKSIQAVRKITVLREVVTDDDYDDDGDVVDSDSQVGSLASTSENSTHGAERRLDSIGPAGKVGFVVSTPKIPGPVYIFNMHDDSPLVGGIRVGDKVIAVDDLNMRTMEATEVPKFLVARHMSPLKKASVLRAMDNAGEVPDDLPLLPSLATSRTPEDGNEKACKETLMARILEAEATRHNESGSVSTSSQSNSIRSIIGALTSSFSSETKCDTINTEMDSVAQSEHSDVFIQYSRECEASLSSISFVSESNDVAASAYCSNDYTASSSSSDVSILKDVEISSSISLLLQDTSTGSTKDASISSQAKNETIISSETVIESNGIAASANHSNNDTVSGSSSDAPIRKVVRVSSSI